MILVLLGTQNNSFKRLLEEIDKLIEKKIIDEEVIVQAGYTKYESSKMKIFDMISKKELDNYYKNANLIITHGGVGSIITGLENGKKIIAIPRLNKYGEHVNDHQIKIVNLFNEKGYILGLNSVEQLEVGIKKVNDFIPVEFTHNNEKMLKIIEDFIEKV